MTKTRLIILHTESSTGWGGQEIRIIKESLGMTKQGHRVIIAAFEKSNIFKKAIESGIDVFPTSFKKKNPMSVLKMISLINKERVDIINTHSSSDSWVATIAAKFAKVKPKIIRTRHLSTPIGRNTLSHLIYNILPDAIITTGKTIKHDMINYNGFNPNKIFSIPTGVDIDRFDPSRVKPCIIKDGFLIGAIGVLRNWKGHSYLIEAVPLISDLVPDARFLVVGKGPQYKNLIKKVDELKVNDRVLFLGHREDIPEILSSLDVLIHPSYESEGVPQSVLQAMAMEKPVVASDVGSLREIVVDGKTGFLIEPKNPSLIAEKVLELYRNPQMRMHFGKEGRKCIEENYTLDRMIDKVETLYESLLKIRGHSC